MAERLLLLLTTLLFLSCSSKEVERHAHQGIMDLRGADLSKEALPLNGEWTLIWNGQDTLYSAQPSSWTSLQHNGKALPMQGQARYELFVLLDSTDTEPLVLSTKEINSESTLWVNGKRIPDIGKKRLNIILNPQRTGMHIRIDVSNSSDIRPGIPCPVYLGTFSAMNIREQRYLGIQAVLVGVFLLMSALYFASWILRRKERRSMLLAFYSLVWGAFSFFQGVEASPLEVLFPGISTLWIQKGYLFSVILAFPLTNRLWLELFPTKILRKTLPLLDLASLAFALTLFLPGPIWWKWFFLYLIVGNVYMLMLLIAVIITVWKRVPDAWLFGIGLLVFYSTVAMGTLHFQGEWVGAGALALVLTDSFLLTRRRIQAFDTVEAQRIELLRMQHLKEELSCLAQEKHQSERREKQLAALLDHLEQPIIVLNDDNTVCYTNQSLNQFWGHSEPLLGKSWSQLCVEERNMENGMVACHLYREWGTNWITVAQKIDLEISNESLLALFFQNSVRSPNPNPENFPTPPNNALDPHRLAKTILEQSLQIWTQCTGLDKASFAETSLLWKVYMDANGWHRTPTLDKYLELAKMPRLPKWRKVLDSADFVLATAQFRAWNDPQIQELKVLRDQLEKII
jgi:PAS domain-containing protein